jgi:hypothetical protein
MIAGSVTDRTATTEPVSVHKHCPHLTSSCVALYLNPRSLPWFGVHLSDSIAVATRLYLQEAQRYVAGSAAVISTFTCTRRDKNSASVATLSHHSRPHSHFKPAKR